jgi:inner membrane protein
MKTTIENFFSSTSFKFIVIGTLSLLLLIPAAMIRQLITEREERNKSVIAEISNSWSRAQTIAGPFISIPTETSIMENNREIITQSTFHLMPEKLDIIGSADPLVKKRGIYSSVVYASSINITGYFNLNDQKLERIFKTGIEKEKAYLGIGLSDLRGIGNKTSVLLNGELFQIEPGLLNRDISEKGIQVPVNIELLKMENKTLSFNIMLDLKGSSDLAFIPVGKITETTIVSTWPDPSFTGSFLPESKEISEKGFSATWEINYLNRDYPQNWYDQSFHVADSEFGVNFLIPVDHYQKSERSVKYAFMFIALSFLVFFLTEVILKSRIHPIQYLLVGFALIIFYTLLISLAEHLGFNIAYAVSTVATTLLVGFYMKSSAGSTKVGLISGMLLLVLYGFLFTTLQLQQYSLLMGSIGMFLILATIMIISRNINWYREDFQNK